MSKWSRTWREVDGENVVGSWRHAFINNGGSYYLTDLIVYADGLIDCWGLVTLDEFRDKLRTGWVATTFKDGAHASAHEVASWTFTNVRSWVKADELYAEVVGEIEALNGRLDAGGICLKRSRSTWPTRRRRTGGAWRWRTATSRSTAARTSSATKTRRTGRSGS